MKLKDRNLVLSGFEVQQIDPQNFISTYLFRKPGAFFRSNNGTALALLAGLGLSACGGGSSSGDTKTNLPGTSDGEDEVPDTSDTGNEDQLDDIEDADDVLAGLDFGGGIGGGVVNVAAPPSSSNYKLTLYKTGSTYATTSVSGFSLVGDSAYYNVANSTDNNYSIELNADGAGILTFDFVDADDIVTLRAGSKLSGFSQLKVVDGTVDVTQADMGGINYVSVASGIKLTAAQVLDLSDIVIRSGSGRVEVEVASQTEIDQIKAAMASGQLELFSPADLLDLSPASGGSLTQDAINAGNLDLNARKQSTSLAPVEMSGLQTLLASKSNVMLTIDNNDNYINKAEAGQPVKLYVSDLTGYSVESVNVGGINLTGSDGVYTLNPADFSDGTHEITVTLTFEAGAETLQGASQNSITLDASVTIDRSAPTSAQVSISGAENGLNAAEVAALREVYVTPNQGDQVLSVEIDGVALGKSAGVYYLDARKFVDGAYDLDILLSDAAGNVSSQSASFVVDLDSLQEADIDVEGGDLYISAVEAEQNVVVGVDLLGASLVSSSFNGQPVSLSSDSSFNINPKMLADGIYMIEITSTDGQGSEIVSTRQLLIDRLAPADANIEIPGAEGGLTLQERLLSDFIDVTVKPDVGAEVISVALGGNKLNEVGNNIYRIDDVADVSPGFHTISVLSQDVAGNQTSTLNDIMFVGGSMSPSDMFDFESSTSAGVVTVEAFVKNFPSVLGDGIKSLSFWLDVGGSLANYIGGSYRMLADGAFYSAPTEGGAKGDVLSSSAFATNWNAFDEPFFSFQVTTSGADRIDLELVDFTLYTPEMSETNFGTLSVSFEV